jgi:hypothetical protein
MSLKFSPLRAALSRPGERHEELAALKILKKTVLFVTILVAMPGADALARDKTDLVYMSNGDRITGEIKQLGRGILQVKTDAMGTLQIEWEEVQNIESAYVFQFERTDGTRVTGKIAPATEERSITLQAGLGKITFAHERLVRIAPIEKTFWDRLDGSFSFGYSFTKASDVAQTNFGLRVSHRSEEQAFTLNGSTIITQDQADVQTDRTEVLLGITQFRTNRWFNGYLLGFEANDKLGLDLRTSLGAGIGRYLVQTNENEFSLIGGLNGTIEDLDEVHDGSRVTQNKVREESLEALLGAQYQRYIFDEPVMDLSIRYFLFPSLTDSGRVRSQLNINLRWELVKDLFWDLNYYNTYDSQPPSGSRSTSDYGVVTSLGYSF